MPLPLKSEWDRLLDQIQAFLNNIVKHLSFHNQYNKRLKEQLLPLAALYTLK